MTMRSAALGALAGAIVGGCITAALMRRASGAIASDEAGHRGGSRKRRGCGGAGGSERAEAPEYPEHVMREVYSRIQTFFGDAGFKSLRESFVVVVGIGGVGSHAAHMLARSGVGVVRVIDFDQVTLSSLNRHAVAGLADVGRPKAEVLAQALTDIVPWCKVDARAAMFTEEQAGELLEPHEGRLPDFVVDCIDDVTTKGALLAKCKELGLRVISAMCAGAKADPTRLQIGSINDASHDPLAAKMRWRLKKSGIDTSGIDVIYSSEKPRLKLLPLTDEQAQEPQEFGNVEYFRTRIMPVLGTSPAIMGQAMAAFVLCDVAGKPFRPEPVAGLSSKSKLKFLQHLKNREIEVFGNRQPVADKDDVDFLVTELWRSKCAVTLERLERQPMVITRWRRERGPSLNNFVLLRNTVADKLDAVAQPEDVFDPEVIARVDSTLAIFDAVGRRRLLSKDPQGREELCPL
uniref:THIF-type NAD/FAD binding fold domain-containing protein n=1 Tax=Rhizochromulina marina TaxID=1034831 RepID=A0A7S2SSC0_9STRA|mmetsp:Transcript_6158/g.17982  ORF Transcript_6158/g.17982 Transcript_6158/m.17982 type:complete len:462 (+) Transcript_6158:2-1387(+)